MHANHIARHTDNQRMQAVLQWVGVGSVIMMGAAAGVHLVKDIFWSNPRHHQQRMLDDLDRHDREREGPRR